MAVNRSFTRAACHALLRRLEAADLVVRDHDAHTFRTADPALALWLRTGGIAAEPAPAILGDLGERVAARQLMRQGFRPVYQSYRSLGPADLVSLEPGRRIAVQVKRTTLPLYVSETAFQRLTRWAAEQDTTALLCRVDPETDEAQWWRWSDGRPTRKSRRFHADDARPTALELLP